MTRGPAGSLELYREDRRTVKNGGARGPGPGGGGRGRDLGCGFDIRVRTMMIMTTLTICYQSDLLLNGTLKRAMRIMGSVARPATKYELYTKGNIIHMPCYSILSLLTLLLQAVRIAYCFYGVGLLQLSVNRGVVVIINLIADCCYCCQH